nr:MAG TPA: hypothetical protein [Caudoviricetes sp.]
MIPTGGRGDTPLGGPRAAEGKGPAGLYGFPRPDQR